MASTGPYKALIFDMDGLMVDTEPIYWDVARKLAKRHGGNVLDSTLRKMMGRSRLEAMRVLSEECGIRNLPPEDLLAEREAMLLDRYAHGVEPMPGLHQILARFHGRLKLAVATSAPRKFTDVLLPALNVSSHFEVVQTGDEIVKGKPDPEIYLATASRLGIDPQECIVLEDSHAGALAAHRAGAYVIAIPTALTAGEDFSFADAQTRNLTEASDQIDRLVQKY